jgi:hypothetical protein
MNNDETTISQTENFVIWRSDEEDEGVLYHVELGGITLHITPEEWDELVTLFKSIE